MTQQNNVNNKSNEKDQEKVFFGMITKGEDGNYHSEFGDTWTPRQYHASKIGCLWLTMASLGLVACAVLRGCEEIKEYKERHKKAKEKPAQVENCQTNYMPMVSNQVFRTR